MKNDHIEVRHDKKKENGNCLKKTTGTMNDKYRKHEQIRNARQKETKTRRITWKGMNMK